MKWSVEVVDIGGKLTRLAAQRGRFRIEGLGKQRAVPAVEEKSGLRVLHAGAGRGHRRHRVIVCAVQCREAQVTLRVATGPAAEEEESLTVWQELGPDHVDL